MLKASEIKNEPLNPRDFIDRLIGFVEKMANDLPSNDPDKEAFVAQRDDNVNNLRMIDGSDKSDILKLVALYKVHFKNFPLGRSEKFKNFIRGEIERASESGSVEIIKAISDSVASSLEEFEKIIAEPEQFLNSKKSKNLESPEVKEKNWVAGEVMERIISQFRSQFYEASQNKDIQEIIISNLGKSHAKTIEAIFLHNKQYRPEGLKEFLIGIKKELSERRDALVHKELNDTLQKIIDDIKKEEKKKNLEAQQNKKEARANHQPKTIQGWLDLMETAVNDSLKTRRKVDLKPDLQELKEKLDSEQKKLDSEQKKSDSEEEKSDSEQKKSDSEEEKLDSEQKKLDSEQKKLDSEEEKSDSEQKKSDSLSSKKAKVVNSVFSKSGSSPLYFAVKSDRDSVLSFLLIGAQIDSETLKEAVNQFPKTASVNNFLASESVLKLLLEQGSSPNLDVLKDAALHAIKSGKAGALELILNSCVMKVAELSGPERDAFFVDLSKAKDPKNTKDNSELAKKINSSQAQVSKIKKVSSKKKSKNSETEQSLEAAKVETTTGNSKIEEELPQEQVSETTENEIKKVSSEGLDPVKGLEAVEVIGGAEGAEDIKIEEQTTSNDDLEDKKVATSKDNSKIEVSQDKKLSKQSLEDLDIVFKSFNNAKAPEPDNLNESRFANFFAAPQAIEDRRPSKTLRNASSKKASDTLVKSPNR